jgi:hypothetical protein
LRQATSSDRDLKQIAEPVLVELLVGDTLDDPPDRVPVDPGQPGGRGRVALGHQPRDEILKISGESGAVAGERDAFSPARRARGSAGV